MSKHQPLIPPASRTTKGPGGQGASGGSAEAHVDIKEQNRQRNLDQQGRQGNIKKNTTHQGFQQDR